MNESTSKSLTAVQRKRIRSFIAELRTTRRAQGNNLLNYVGKRPSGRRERKYCCLGVACEIAIRDGLALDKHVVKEGWTNPEHMVYVDPNANEDSDGSILPHVVQHWYGFLETDPILT